MSAYAIAQVHSVEFGPDIVEYLERIDATLDPFGGHFIVHGGTSETVEGTWGQGGTIVIAFPDLERARAWWNSPAYRDILPLRTRHMVADIVLVDGVRAGYRAADSLRAGA
ncbi:DUF1330 domain-containing protein [Kitasatospora sp. NPDC048194]|uniref:DUF1330 domain-containing protein n=1 Tax=Kitasatospora sp. NPDC048194 TaxID=3364045 RepID=UPI00371E5D26